MLKFIYFFPKIWVIIFFCCFWQQSQADVLQQLQIFIQTADGDKNLFFSNSKNSFFDFYGENAFSCKVPVVFYEKNDISSRKILMKNNNDPNLPLNSIVVKNISVESSYYIIKPNIIGSRNFTLGSGVQLSFSIDYGCDTSHVTKEDFWAIIFLKIDIENSDSLTFSYKKVCREDFIDYNFDYSFIIIALFCILMVAWQSKRPKILSTLKNFEGYEINIKFVICYIIIASTLLITLIYSQTVMMIIYTALMAIVSCLAISLFFNELLTGNLLRHNISKILIQVPKIGNIPIFFLVGLILSLPLVIYWAFSYDWIISDILTLIIAAVCLKLIKFKSLKSATYFFFAEIIFEIIWGVIFLFGFERSYDQFFSSDFTLPLKIECLTIQEFLKKKCVWISITNIVYPGLLLSYFNRYDASKNFSIYYFFSLIALVLGNVFWILVQSLIEFNIPASIYCFTLMIGFTLILAHKRNENGELWNGTFFDVELADPLINSRPLMENNNNNAVNERNEKQNLTVNSEINGDESFVKGESEPSLMEATVNLDEGGSKMRDPTSSKNI